MQKFSCIDGSRDISEDMTKMREKEQLYDFLMGLDESFHYEITQILAMKPSPTLGEAYHIIVEEEQQKIIAAFSMQLVSNNRTTVSTVATVKGDVKRKDGDRRNSKKERPRYSHCQKIGHEADKCFEIIGYPSH